MAEIPTLADEHAKRPGRERQSLVGERTCIINRLSANLARLGIRSFRPTSNRLEALRTPEGACPGEHVGRTAAQHGTPPLRQAADQRDRDDTWRERPTSNATSWYRCSRVTFGIAKALARNAGLTEAPRREWQKRRERGLAKAGNARVRRGMIELALGASGASEVQRADRVVSRANDARGSRASSLLHGGGS